MPLNQPTLGLYEGQLASQSSLLQNQRVGRRNPLCEGPLLPDLDDTVPTGRSNESQVSAMDALAEKLGECNERATPGKGQVN